MPIMLTRKDGPPTPFRNAEYIPFYYFIPKSILSRCGAELNAIPRNPQELFRNRATCEFVESDLFRLLIIDATAFMVWPYMGFGEYMEIYSGYDPAWRFAHCPDYWIKELEDEGILASTGALFKSRNTFIVTAVLNEMQRQTSASGVLLEDIRQVIREELQEVSFAAASPVFEQVQPELTEEQQAENEKAGHSLQTRQCLLGQCSKCASEESQVYR